MASLHKVADGPGLFDIHWRESQEIWNVHFVSKLLGRGGNATGTREGLICAHRRSSESVGVRKEKNE